MSYDKNDFSEFDGAMKSHIQTADGKLTIVSGSGTIQFSLTLKLTNCLYVPKLSHKLMSPCDERIKLYVTMHPNFCVLQYQDEEDNWARH